MNINEATGRSSLDVITNIITTYYFKTNTLEQQGPYSKPGGLAILWSPF